MDKLFERNDVTNGEAIDFMFAIMDVFKDDEPSRTNGSINNEKCWNLLFGSIKDEPKDKTVNEHVWRNIKQNFKRFSIFVEKHFDENGRSK